MPQGFKMARAFIISAKLRLLKSVRKTAYYGVEFFLKSHFFFTLEMHTNMDWANPKRIQGRSKISLIMPKFDNQLFEDLHVL